MAGTAPALLSHTDGELRQGAEYSPDGHYLGIPVWNVISGPYLLVGADSIKQATGKILHSRPLIAPFRDRLGELLAPTQPMHSVYLYRAAVAQDDFAEVLIDNRAADTTPLLTAVPFPANRGSGFISVRQFLLCLSPRGTVEEVHY